MGTCISKCCLNSPSPPPPLTTTSTPPPPSSSSSSSSSSSTSSSSVSSPIASSSSSSSSSYYTSKHNRPYSNDFLLSRIKENPHIIILDPHKYDEAPKPCSVKLPSKRERSSSPQQRSRAGRPKSFRGAAENRPALSKPIRTLSPANKLAKGCNRLEGRNLSEKARPPSSACNSLSRLDSKNGRGVPHLEDIDNPFISMECFIFL